MNSEMLIFTAVSSNSLDNRIKRVPAEIFSLSQNIIYFIYPMFSYGETPNHCPFQSVDKVIFVERKVLGNEEFPKWNPQAEIAFFAEENRTF